ncbi:WD40-repeat-containing domain protein [Vararia minispora EC-137]|uniref:WD40-repeat-containing domain protein n=1 Tax=Vararia minispora EC-137 TaxID=1314806 RepID=A0ACB8QIS5_9AGAM|nr:WD40-repeat-containing domain protein [Vararia minispora EC-137]
MRVRTLEIHWHDGKPIASCDFQPASFKKARPASDNLSAFARQSYRLATGGEDNHVRLWMVHPNILPPALAEGASSAGDAPPAPRPPRVEYLATLSRHSAAVNVVRFSPNGELIASAGDDGMVIIWSASSTPVQSVYGSDLNQDDLPFEKEFWKPRTTFRCTTMQVYDLAWSPTGEYVLTGSTDNVARIFLASDGEYAIPKSTASHRNSNPGKCISEIAEHHHYVQGVAWDPLNEYIATQSSDRSMHIYSVSSKQGVLEVHAVGKNTRMTHQHHARAPSVTAVRRESTASDTESVITSVSEQRGREDAPSALVTPAASVTSTPSHSHAMFPPPSTSSRRSSFSGSNAPSSPALYATTSGARYARSPSPAPALPAIRAPPQMWSTRLYGDESFTNFFRRLNFSPDGGLLLTPAGHFEDPSVHPTLQAHSKDGRKSAVSEPSNPTSGSSVYIYSRANFARPPIAQLPGHKKASIAVRFSPILYELRQDVQGADLTPDTKHVIVEAGREETILVDIGPSAASASSQRAPSASPAPMSPAKSTLLAPLAMPAPVLAQPPSALTLPSPVLSASDSISLRALSPAVSATISISKPPTPMVPPPPSTGSLFNLPYRMLFAIATMDTVTIHDTQQAGPVCILTKLHYDEFTDMSWSPDGQCLMLASRDGYCTLVVFDDILPAHHTQQPALQFQAVAHAHALPVTTSTPASTPHIPHVSLPSVSPALVPSSGVGSASPAAVPAKRAAELPLTPASSVGADLTAERSAPDQQVPSTSEERDRVDEPPKKKRRVALTRVGDIGS